jgi:hypothetical protein
MSPATTNHVAAPLALTLKVIEGGDDDFGRPFVRFAAGVGRSVLHLENRAQVAWFMKFFDTDTRFEIVAGPVRAERPAPPPPTTVPSAGVPRQDKGPR